MDLPPVAEHTPMTVVADESPAHQATRTTTGRAEPYSEFTVGGKRARAQHRGGAGTLVCMPSSIPSSIPS
ncbi:hypothetical protein [Streptomyces cacaoi]